MKKSKYMKGGGKSSKYKAAGGMKTEVGKEAKVQTYNEYVKKCLVVELLANQV